MTRLKTEWIDYMLDGMNDYNSSHVLHMKCMAAVLFTRIFYV